MLEGSDGSGSQTRRCYITITAVPSLDNCSDCYQVATSYEEEGTVSDFILFVHLLLLPILSPGLLYVDTVVLGLLLCLYALWYSFTLPGFSGWEASWLYIGVWCSWSLVGRSG